MCPKSNETGVIKTLLPKSNFFKVIPFHLKTLVHSSFPRFKTFLENIFWDLFELRRRSYFDGIDVGKMGSLLNIFDLREEKKVTRGQIGGIWGVFQRCNVSFCKQLTNTQGCVSRKVIVMEHPCMGFPKAPPLVTH